MKEKNIVLIGMPGCGKTTFGRYLAKLLNREFLDADEEIVRDAGRSIPELFAQGEECFRDAESATTERLSRLEGKVLAMGGGVVKRRENIEHLRESGFIVLLDRSPADIVGDVRTDTRPLLADGAEKIYALYAERAALYEAAADAVVRNRGEKKQVLQKLLAASRVALQRAREEN